MSCKRRVISVVRHNSCNNQQRRGNATAFLSRRLENLEFDTGRVSTHASAKPNAKVISRNIQCLEELQVSPYIPEEYNHFYDDILNCPVTKDDADAENYGVVLQIQLPFARRAAGFEYSRPICSSTIDVETSQPTNKLGGLLNRSLSRTLSAKIRPRRDYHSAHVNSTSQQVFLLNYRICMFHVFLTLTGFFLNFEFYLRVLKEALKKLNHEIRLAVILPVVLYGSETWTLTLREEQNLRVFENKVLRKIFEAKRDEVTGDWRKLHNAELHALYSSPDIIKNIKSRRLRWAGHVARIEC
ncbi:hypothetical protein ANN_21717 [Periplaneta americana]|uniref:Uncharacterized protein n=1 Tax=Periplaneta americana TaxID=6978 RepID=A0ABQ8S6J4_PERAM|nr:hypothetical protein ANN_21717 [Periplaneta americana]